MQNVVTCAVPDQQSYQVQWRQEMSNFEENSEDDEKRPLKRRKNHRRSKAEAIYGVFLSSSESEKESHRRTERRSAARFRNETPITFVAASSAQQSKPPQERPSKKKETSDDELLNQLFPPELRSSGMLVGYASSSESDSAEESRHHFEHHPHHRGLGHFSSSPAKSPSAAADPVSLDADSSAEESDLNAAATVATAGKGNRYKFSAIAEEQVKEAAKQAPSLNGAKMSKLYGKGFSMLKKMGYTGGGLGKEGAGILNPLDVKVRKKNRGLQDYGEKTAARDTAKDELEGTFPETSDMSAVDILLGGQEKKVNKGRWRKGETRRVIYKTAGEIAAESRMRQRAISQRQQDAEFARHRDTNMESMLFELDGDALGYEGAKLRRQQVLRRKQLQATGTIESLPRFEVPLEVIDMTGPVKRIISPEALYAKLSQASRAADGRESATEKRQRDFLGTIRRNLNIHIDRLETDIAEQASLRVTEEEAFEAHARNEEQAYAQAMESSENVTAFEHVLSKINNYRNSPAFKLMEKQMGQASLTGTAVQSRKAAIAKYTLGRTQDINEDVQMMISDEEDETKIETDEPQLIATDDLYTDITRLFSELRREYPNLYETARLSKLASQFAYAVLRFQEMRPEFILPADLLYSTSLLVQFRAECLMSNVKTEYQNEIETLRRFWQSAIDKKAVEGLCHSLSLMTVTVNCVLKHPQINPRAQDVKPVLTLFNWLGPLSSDCVAQLLEQHFFPKWLAVLQLWLTSPTLDLEEVYLWYNGWRSIFPETLLLHSIVQSSLMKGLRAIEAHLETLNLLSSVPQVPQVPQAPPAPTQINDLGIPDLAPSEPMEPPPEVPLPPIKQFKATPVRNIEAASVDSRLMNSVRLIEILEAVAEKNNILMLPKPGRMQNGKQIYSFGGILFYIDLGVVYALNKQIGAWNCLSPQQLLIAATELAK